MTSPRHVIVCGAGVMGAAVAYYLALRGVAVTVIERTGVACAASGKSGGFLALDWCDDSPVGPLARLSFALHGTLPGELSADYGYRRMDTYMLAARERGVVTGGHRMPAAPAWIDGPAVVAGRLGSAETTAQVHPALFTTALLNAARARGAKLRMGVVERVALPRRPGCERGRGRRDARGRRDRARDGAVDGPRPRGRAAAYSRAQGLQRDARRAGRAGPRAVHGLPLADGRALEPEIMPRPDGTVYVCGMADLQPLPESAEGVEVSEAGCAVLAGAAGRVSPRWRRRRSSAARPATAPYRDGVPLIGRVPGAPGVYVATGHGPWGMLNAPGTGLALAELIVDGAARSLDLGSFDPARLLSAGRVARGGPHA